MTRNYKDWTIEVREACGSYGDAFHAVCYVKKDNGTKDNIREFWVYKTPAIKSHGRMLNYVTRLLEVPVSEE